MLIIAFGILILAILPIFHFSMDIFVTQNTINDTRETLEIACLATYTKLNQENLSSGVMTIDENLAKTIFYSQVNLLFMERKSISVLTNPTIIVTQNSGKVIIMSKVTIMSAYKIPISVKTSMEFIIDPTMEVA